MMGRWTDPVYQQTALMVLSILFFSGVIVFFLRKKNYYFMSSWGSINSWLIAAPILFLLFALPDPFPLLGLSLVAIYGAKAFFKIMGIYQRNYFVLICYAGILGLAFCIQEDRLEYYNIMPMIVLGVCSFVPLIRNNYKRMIQYISLTLLGFIFLGWSFMHLGLLLQDPTGIYQIMYLLILTEFCDNTNLAIGRYFKTWRFFPMIDPKRTLWSTLVSVTLTLALAWIMRLILPDLSDKYWYTTALIASLGGMWGDLVMTVVRRDAGVRIVGGFILGRGDFLRRMDRLIFVAPLYYYLMRGLA